MRWQLAENVRWMPVDDGIVIFCAAVDTFVDLSASGAELWNVLEGNDWADHAAIDHLLRNYVVGEAEAGEIVRAFVDDLKRSGVLIRRTG